MNKSTLIRFGVVLTLLAVTGGGYGWWSVQMQGAHTDVTQLAQKIQHEQATLAAATAARAQLAALSGDETATRARFVADADIVSFLGVLESAGRAVGATVSIVSVAPTANTARPMLTVSAKATGSFDAVMRAVGDIENVPYYVTVRTLTLDHTTGTSDSAKKSRWTATFTLSVGSTNATTAAATTTATTTTP